MKLCPICDKQVNGNWCKNCKRFVKPKEYKQSFTINESRSSIKLNSDTIHSMSSGDYYDTKYYNSQTDAANSFDSNDYHNTMTNGHGDSNYDLNFIKNTNSTYSNTSHGTSYYDATQTSGKNAGSGSYSKSNRTTSSTSGSYSKSSRATSSTSGSYSKSSRTTSATGNASSANTRTASSATNSTSGSYDAYSVSKKNVVVSANKKNGGKDPIKRSRAITVATALVVLGLSAIISRLQQLENHREKYENFTLPSIDMSSFSSLGEEFSKLASYAVIPYKEGDDPQRWSDMITKLGYPQLAECLPAEINEYSDGVQYKLNPERLSGLDIECDTYYHFDCYYEDLHVMFGPLMVYELIEDVGASDSNYVWLDPTTGDKMVVWQSELDFISENGTIMEAYYDTCSKRVHYIEMQSYDNWDEMGLLADTFLNNVDKPYWTTGEALAAFLAQEANLLIGTALDDPDVLYNCKALSSGVIEAAPNVDMTMELYYFEPYNTEGARPYFNLRIEPKIIY